MVPPIQKTATQKPVTRINGFESDYISVDDRGLNYGDGVFETILVRNGRPVFWAQHWQRLAKGTAQLAINCPTEDVLLEDIQCVLQKQRDGVLKIIVTRGQNQGQGYQYTENHSPTRIVRFFPDSKTAHDKECMALKYSAYPLATSAFAGIKHLNRLEQIIAKAELHHSKYNEIICCDKNDNIVECSSANIFICMNNELYTPALNNCGIKGIVRDWVMDTATKNNIIQVEKTITKAMLKKSDEIFITNSIIGVMAVTQVEQQKFNLGPITTQLKERYVADINK